MKKLLVAGKSIVVRHADFFKGLQSDAQFLWVGGVFVVMFGIACISAYALFTNLPLVHNPGSSAVQVHAAHISCIAGCCGLAFALILGLPSIAWILRWFFRSIREVRA